jgi:hypothetical protein
MKIEAIEYAKRTTGTLLWCSVGVFSGDGQRSLDKTLTVSKATVKFLNEKCTPYTQAQNDVAMSRARFQENRCKRLAKQAIELGNYESAKRLVEIAASLHETVAEFISNNRIVYVIN